MPFFGSNPYAFSGYYEAQDADQRKRMEVARAFSEWRKANPEAGADDIKAFLGMATGGDMGMVSTMANRSQIQRMADEAAKAKAKRLLEEARNKMVDDAKMAKTIEATFAQYLDQTGGNREAAIEATRASFPTSDPKLRKEIDDRIKSINPQGVYDAWSRKTVETRLQEIDSIFQRGGKIEDVNAILPAGLHNHPLVKSKAEYWGRIHQQQEQDRQFQEAQRKAALAEEEEKKIDRKRDIAERIVRSRAGGVSIERIQQLYPEANDPEIIQMVQTLQKGAHEGTLESRLAKIDTEVGTHAEAQVKMLDMGAYTKKGGPLADRADIAGAAEAIARDNYLTPAQLSALRQAALSGKIKSTKFEEVVAELRAAAQAADTRNPINPLRDTLVTRLTEQAEREAPRTYMEQVKFLNKEWGDAHTELIEELQTIHLLKEEERVRVFDKLEKQLSDAEVRIAAQYGSLRPTLFGEKADVRISNAASAQMLKKYAEVREYLRKRKAELQPTFKQPTKGGSPFSSPVPGPFPMY